MLLRGLSANACFLMFRRATGSNVCITFNSGMVALCSVLQVSFLKSRRNVSLTDL